jgi:hypothetical protein
MRKWLAVPIFPARFTSAPGGLCGERTIISSNLTRERKQLHELVDRLAPGQLHTVRG